jgi:hypothetical protein
MMTIPKILESSITPFGASSEVVVRAETSAKIPTISSIKNIRAQR